MAYEDELESSLAKQAEGKTFKVIKKYGKKKVDTDFSGLAGMAKMMEMLMGGPQTSAIRRTPSWRSFTPRA